MWFISYIIIISFYVFIVITFKLYLLTKNPS